MKTAVLISGELRFLEECLPTMKFINDDVDVYVSTWDTTEIRNQLLGIDIKDSITEERIRKVIPNATILIEPLSCFASKKYSDRMIYKWQTGWRLIESSNKKYDRIIVTRPDLFFSSSSTFEYDDAADFEVIWYTKPGYMQDGMFKLSAEFSKKFFNHITPELWHGSKNGDIHTWFYDEVVSLSPCKIGNLFAGSQSIFCRPPGNYDTTSVTFQSIIRRQFDWRDSNSIMFALKHNSDFSLLLAPWKEEVTTNTILTYRSGRLKRRSSSNTLLIISGIVRNFHSFCLSLPMFGNVDLALASWHDGETNRLKDILRIDHVNLAHRHLIDQSLQECKKSKFHNNIEYMLVHFENALSIAERMHHDTIIITRPDCVYLPHGDKLDFSDVNGLGIFYDQPKDHANDILWVFKRNLIDKLKLLPNTLRQLSLDHNSNNVHELIPKALRQLEIPIDDTQTKLKIANECIQRDSFEFLLDDVFSKDYFTAVKCDSASWWRRTYKSRFFFSTQGL